MNTTYSSDFFTKQRSHSPQLLLSNLNQTFYHKKSEMSPNYALLNKELNQDYLKPNRFSLFATENKKGFRISNRYQVRNSRKHTKLKIVQTSNKKNQSISGNSIYPKSQNPQFKANSTSNINQLKSLMNEEINKLSLPNKYKKFLQKFSGTQFAGQLRSELAFVPNNLPKFSKKKKNYHKKGASFQADNRQLQAPYGVMGNKIEKKHKAFVDVINEKNELLEQKQRGRIEQQQQNAIEKKNNKKIINKKNSLIKKNQQQLCARVDQPLTGWNHQEEVY